MDRQDEANSHFLASRKRLINEKNGYYDSVEVNFNNIYLFGLKLNIYRNRFK
jgi:hypothetical protein